MQAYILWGSDGYKDSDSHYELQSSTLPQSYLCEDYSAKLPSSSITQEPAKKYISNPLLDEHITYKVIGLLLQLLVFYVDNLQVYNVNQIFHSIFYHRYKYCNNHFPQNKFVLDWKHNLNTFWK